MKLSDLLDKKISKVRYNYVYENEYGLQEFQTQIKLSNGAMFLIPVAPDTDFDLSDCYSKSKTTSFQKAKRCGLSSRLMFRNKRIIDIHFKYLEGEPFLDSSSILELENGKFLTENRCGPLGLTDISLIVMNRTQFEELSNDEISLKSLRNDILTN